MTIRDLSKAETRLNILSAAKEEFLLCGMQGISTLKIARRAGVAHGTVFFHFKTKEELITEVLNRQIYDLTAELSRQLDETKDLRDLLQTHLNFLEKEEDFFSILAREIPFYPPEIRRIVLSRDVAVREFLYRALVRGMETSVFKALDPTLVLNFWFGTLDFYLGLRSSFSDSHHIIPEKRDALLETFLKMISN